MYRLTFLANWTKSYVASPSSLRKGSVTLIRYFWRMNWYSIWPHKPNSAGSIPASPTNPVKYIFINNTIDFITSHVIIVFTSKNETYAFIGFFTGL